MSKENYPFFQGKRYGFLGTRTYGTLVCHYWEEHPEEEKQVEGREKWNMDEEVLLQWVLTKTQKELLWSCRNFGKVSLAETVVWVDAKLKEREE